MTMKCETLKSHSFYVVHIRNAFAAVSASKHGVVQNSRIPAIIVLSPLMLDNHKYSNTRCQARETDDKENNLKMKVC